MTLPQHHIDLQLRLHELASWFRSPPLAHNVLHEATNPSRDENAGFSSKKEPHSCSKTPALNKWYLGALSIATTAPS